MTDTAASSSKGNPAGKQEPKRGFFSRTILFVRQIIAELRKVVVPTRKELVRFTITVLAFVIIMMLIVTGLDFLFGTGAVWLFGGDS
ncbi:preprotein translocase subunit SecE [Arthrobacter sp. JZ12]|uniref:preprotein translocase subunit SecE n=1 Tax=Arthrobacter sp. JZ12 TaxID=2654190 RepID=UPI002B48DBD9|nr:preprotein translocase subunit SecE [Arthrobacter sp. JZ12]